MSLPAVWVDRIFDKLTLTYGQAFLRRWVDIDMDAVKADWGHELAGFAQQPRAIAWALQNLPPEKPPTVLEFRQLARKTPAEVIPQVEGPKADPERVAAELAKLAPIRNADAQIDHKAWARQIIERSHSGQRIAAYTLWSAKIALRMPA